MRVQASWIARPARSSAAASPLRTPAKSTIGMTFCGCMGRSLNRRAAGTRCRIHAVYTAKTPRASRASTAASVRVRGAAADGLRRRTDPHPCFLSKFDQGNRRCTKAGGLIFSSKLRGIYCLAPPGWRARCILDVPRSFGELHEDSGRLEAQCVDAGPLCRKRRRARRRPTRESQEGRRARRRHRDAVRAVRFPRERSAGRVQQGPVRRRRQGAWRQSALHRPALAERAARSRCGQVRHGRRSADHDPGARRALRVLAADRRRDRCAAQARERREPQDLRRHRRQGGRRRQEFRAARPVEDLCRDAAQGARDPRIRRQQPGLRGSRRGPDLGGRQFADQYRLCRQAAARSVRRRAAAVRREGVFRLLPAQGPPTASRCSTRSTRRSSSSTRTAVSRRCRRSGSAPRWTCRRPRRR